MKKATRSNLVFCEGLALSCIYGIVVIGALCGWCCSAQHCAQTKLTCAWPVGMWSWRLVRGYGCAELENHCSGHHAGSLWNVLSTSEGSDGVSYTQHVPQPQRCSTAGSMGGVLVLGKVLHISHVLVHTFRTLSVLWCKICSRKRVFLVVKQAGPSQ